MIRKLIAIVAAILINCAVLVWFHAWSAAAVASAAPASGSGKTTTTLPVITVHPSADQLRALREERAAPVPPQADAGGRDACIEMPYYSFATPCTAAVSG
ncbi:MAG: hypothetical protein OJF55_000022 [Rhodanobacteraceae bacterium]|jgi:hypothetical protein|nr:MAG: hypothetical protein OJF55_000022 [Rhodanobacteraceae bacterium]